MAEYEAAAGLLSQLQALGAGPLWPREAASLASPRTPSEHSIATSVGSTCKTQAVDCLLSFELAASC